MKSGKKNLFTVHHKDVVVHLGSLCCVCLSFIVEIMQEPFAVTLVVSSYMQPFNITLDSNQ